MRASSLTFCLFVVWDGVRDLKKILSFSPPFDRNEWFRQPVSSQPTMIDFKVKDYNRFSHSVELGQCQWNLWDLLRPQQEVLSVDKWLPLYPLGHGELHVKIEYLPPR